MNTRKDSFFCASVIKIIEFYKKKLIPFAFVLLEKRAVGNPLNLSFATKLTFVTLFKVRKANIVNKKVFNNYKTFWDISSVLKDQGIVAFLMHFQGNSNFNQFNVKDEFRQDTCVGSRIVRFYNVFIDHVRS